MRETILVRHPAPLRHVPRGARNERLAFARIETPAVLDAIDPDALSPLRTPDGAEIRSPYRLRDGSLWGPLEAEMAKARVPVAPEAFRAFLRGDAGQPDELRDALVRRFRQSHLVACHSVPARLDKTETRLETGEPIDVEGSRSIAHDGREACARSTAAWLAREVALVGDAVWTRVRPLVRYRHEGQTHDLTLVAAPLAHPGAIPLFGFGSVDAGVAAYRNEWDRPPDRSHHLSNVMAALPDGYGTGEADAYLANVLVEDVFRIRGTHHGFLRGGEEIEEAKAALLAARYAGMTGRIGEAEAPDLLRVVRRAAGVCVDRNPNNFSTWSLSRACRYLDAGILPRLDRVDDADADAVAGLVR